jgi:hypothetical protein
MTLASYWARLAKHLTQTMTRRTTADAGCGTIDLCSRAPHLSWINAKVHPQGNGGRSGNSGHAEEHYAANGDNNNPYQGADGKWYYTDESDRPCEVAYETRAAANVALVDYRRWRNTPKEIAPVENS